MEVIGLVASFLGGAMAAAVLFMFAFVSRLTKLETVVEELYDKIKTLVTSDHPLCSVHSNITERVTILETKVQNLRES